MTKLRFLDCVHESTELRIILYVLKRLCKLDVA